MSIETAVTFKCASNELVGIIHQPGNGKSISVGVLIVVGGPQYRVGSHRQFVQLARELAASGIPAMRFDYRGMGDSEGDQISFEQICPDIRAAVDTFTEYCPFVDRVVLWGLCDAASACLIYSVSDDRINGMILLNPWVKTEAGNAKTYLKHYYSSRLFDKKLWKKILKFEFDYKESCRSLIGLIRQAFLVGRENTAQDNSMAQPFQTRMESRLIDFSGRILFIISGNDFTAAEFKDMVDSSKNWKKKIKEQNIDWFDMENADHTFSRKKWKAQVSDLTIKWVENL